MDLPTTFPHYLCQGYSEAHMFCSMHVGILLYTVNVYPILEIGSCCGSEFGFCMTS